jgi:hypothetical protein
VDLEAAEQARVQSFLEVEQEAQEHLQAEVHPAMQMLVAEVEPVLEAGIRQQLVARAPQAQVVALLVL